MTPPSTRPPNRFGPREVADAYIEIGENWSAADAERIFASHGLDDQEVIATLRSLVATDGLNTYQAMALGILVGLKLETAQRRARIRELDRPSRARADWEAAMISSMSGTSRPSIHASRIVSPSSIRKHERAATLRIPPSSTATPNTRAASPFQSESSGMSTPSVPAHAACDQTESREIASGRTPASPRSSLLSRRSSTSFVQVGDQSQR